MENMINQIATKAVTKQTKTNEWTTEINGYVFTETELQNFLDYSDQTTRFNTLTSVWFFILHWLLFLGAVPLAYILVIVFNGYKLAYNIEFVKCSGNCILQLIFGGLAAGTFYLVTLDYLDPSIEKLKDTASLTNFMHFFLTSTIRAMIIAVKYGYYSPEHMHIVNKTKLSEKLLRF